MPNLEPVEGRETRISQIRPLTDAVSGVTVAITRRARLGDTGVTENFATMQTSGDIDCRTSGRFLRPKVKIAAQTSWDYFQGLELVQTAGGGRR
jgi:hypothetical protein